jgi:hypothetical protein
MTKLPYQNFYKVQMLMLNNNENVLVFGPAASGKCDALEKFVEQYSIDHTIALFTNKTALNSAAYGRDNVTCFNWHPSMVRLNPEWIPSSFDMIIIDGKCENWNELINAFPHARFVMAVRANSQSDIPIEMKRSFRIIAKSACINEESRTKGIVNVKFFKG